MSQTENNRPAPPVAKKVPKTDVLHGDVRVDNYYWLREKTNPDVVSYLNAENAYTEALTKHLAPFKDKLYQEMLGKIKQTDLSVPYRDGEYFYYSRTEEGKQYGIFCRKRGSLAAPEEILIDINELAKGQKYMALGLASVSDDGKKLAYSTDNTGFRQYKLMIKDLETGKTYPEQIERATFAFWAKDNKTIFYGVEDDAKRSYRCYRHTIGSTSGDELIYEEKDALYRLGGTRSDNKNYLFLVSGSSTTSEWRYLSADNPNGEFKVYLPRENDHKYSLENYGDLFYILTNQNAKNYRLVTAPINNPDKKNWKEVIPHSNTVALQGMTFFINHYVISALENGLAKMMITDLRNGQRHDIAFPEPTYSAFPSTNAEFNTNIFRFGYQSMVTPSSIYDYNLDSKERVLLKQTEVLGGYDSSKYQSERIYVTATDGVKVPVSLVYKKDLKRDGARPMFLVAYGSYGFAYPVNFSSNRLSLLDRGVIFALAHIRGGGELGDSWHDQGKMMLKRNTFTDFINVAEHMIREKYTSSDRLVINGGSAGGLLMGAVTNMRPELFKAVVTDVPFVDVINTMLDETLPLTVGEFLEWGNPKVKNEYDYMKSYCPYTNIEAKSYPNILVKTSLNDSQVMYWEPAKYVAKMREMKTDHNQLIFKCNMDAGHSGSSGRYDALKETAFDYAYILSQFGIVD